MGLGNLLEVGLAEAREKGLEARRLVKKAINPIEQRKIASVAAKTFGDAADQYFEAKKGEYGNAKYREMTRLALVRDVAPIRAKAIADISTADVLAIVAPIWSTKWKTADRSRGKIEAVLDYAAAHGLREGDNPARWRGLREHLLPRPDKSKAGHHAAMAYEEAPAFYARLVEEPGVAARALEFTILTAARSGQVIGARWEEIDREAAIWTVRATRMKAGSIMSR
jgi:integrase